MSQNEQKLGITTVVALCIIRAKKGTHGRKGSVGSFVAVCEARCGLAVEDTSKFVEKLSHL